MQNIKVENGKFAVGLIWLEPDQGVAQKRFIADNVRRTRYTHGLVMKNKGESRIALADKKLAGTPSAACHLAQYQANVLLIQQLGDGENYWIAAIANGVPVVGTDIVVGADLDDRIREAYQAAMESVQDEATFEIFCSNESTLFEGAKLGTFEEITGNKSAASKCRIAKHATSDVSPRKVALYVILGVVGYFVYQDYIKKPEVAPVAQQSPKPVMPQAPQEPKITAEEKFLRDINNILAYYSPKFQMDVIDGALNDLSLFVEGWKLREVALRRHDKYSATYHRQTSAPVSVFLKAIGDCDELEITSSTDTVTCYYSIDRQKSEEDIVTSDDITSDPQRRIEFVGALQQIRPSSLSVEKQENSSDENGIGLPVLDSFSENEKPVTTYEWKIELPGISKASTVAQALSQHKLAAVESVVANIDQKKMTIQGVYYGSP